MLDRLIDIVLQFIDQLMPFTVIPYYDRGVRLRFGKPKGVLEYGFHWKIPFADEILTHMVMPTTLNLTEQSLTTRDGQSIVVKGIIKYRVSDVEILLLEVNSATDAISDMVSGLIRDKVITKNWSECNDQTLVSEVSRAAKIESKKWGIEIMSLTFTDLCLMRSLRLMNK